MKQNSKNNDPSEQNQNTIIFTVSEMCEMKHHFGLSYERIHEDIPELSLSTIQKVLGGLVKSPTHKTLLLLSKAFSNYITEFGYTYVDVTPSDDFPLDVAARRKIYEDVYQKAKQSGRLNPSDKGKHYVADPGFKRSPGTQSNINGSMAMSGLTGYTYDDYLKMILPEGKRIEIIDGVIYDMSSPSRNHQLILFEIGTMFRNFIKKNKGKCKVIPAPMDVRLEFDKGDHTVVQPDLMVICDPKKMEDNRAIKGGPDFVLEVLSPSNRLIEMNLKMAKYRENSVREYWVVDQESRTVIKTFWNRDPDDPTQKTILSETINIYTMDDVVPVEIYGGKLSIDFKEISDYLSE